MATGNIIMCGIFGEVYFYPNICSKLTPNVSKILQHRGPNGDGEWLSSNENVRLGHRRLAVIDLSEHASQPMHSLDGRYTIVFNGEIYNFNELREDLLNCGARFSSKSDTEVLLMAYAFWGERCLSKLNGMFAFAIHDRGTSTTPESLFFARDRAGEKPFYFSHSSKSFCFSSELKAISHSCEINLNSLNHYLSLGYVPGNLCLYTGVQKLPPAHCGRVNIQTGELIISRYWFLPQNQPLLNSDEFTLAEEAGSLIEDSVRLRLVADVPLGVLLSGGLDSSLVVAAAARVSSSPIETFTIALPGSGLDEAHHAQKIANFFGTRHHVLPLEKPSLGLLEGLADFIDEPIADSSILPAWLVFGLARKHVTVALGGDGGDELFGGYTDYRTSLADARSFGKLPASLLRFFARFAAQFPAGMPGRNRIASLREGPFQQLIWGRPYFDIDLRKKLFSKAALNDIGGGLIAPENFLLDLFKQGIDPIDGMTRRDFGSILPDDFLVKVDRASMAHSLEVRAPFLDHRLIEFAFGRVPSKWKVSGGVSRRLERILATKWLPPDLDINRKQGFSIPLNDWLRNEGETQLMKRMDGLPKIIQMDYVRKLVRGHIAGRTNGGRIFALIMLAISMRNVSK